MDDASSEYTSSFNQNTWAKRFAAAAIVQGAALVGLTAFLVLSQISFLKPEVSKVMAAGGAGTWLTFGYEIYIMVGVLGVAVSSVFYYYLGSAKSNASIALAWIHLFLMNIGIAAACGMMMYAGYIAGASLLPVNQGGKGYTALQAHELLIGQYVAPISVAILVVLAGVIAGGVGFILTYRKNQELLLKYAKPKTDSHDTAAA